MMPYTKITLVALGSIMTSITCDLSTGVVTIIKSTRAYHRHIRTLKAYSKLELSPNLDERRAYNLIIEKISGAYRPGVHKKHLRTSTRLKLLQMANDQNLNSKDSIGIFPYRDEWDVTIIIGGANTRQKILGPFCSLATNTQAARIIEMISDSDRLFFE